MPNHCENDLYICGTVETVNAVLAFIGADKAEPAFDFDKVIPYPEPFRSMDAEWPRDYRDPNRKESLAAYKAKWNTESDGFNSGGYDWKCKAWGTKWGAYDVKRRDYGEVCVTFQTAWSPPLPIVAKLAEIFPEATLRLEYFECGMQFCGGITHPSKDHWNEDVAEWRPGIAQDKWRSKYGGHRGG